MYMEGVSSVSGVAFFSLQQIPMDDSDKTVLSTSCGAARNRLPPREAMHSGKINCPTLIGAVAAFRSRVPSKYRASKTRAVAEVRRYSCSKYDKYIYSYCIRDFVYGRFFFFYGCSLH